LVCSCVAPSASSLRLSRLYSDLRRSFSCRCRSRTALLSYLERRPLAILSRLRPAPTRLFFLCGIVSIFAAQGRPARDPSRGGAGGRVVGRSENSALRCLCGCGPRGRRGWRCARLCWAAVLGAALSRLEDL
jgi:hypothetical protein